MEWLILILVVGVVIALARSGRSKTSRAEGESPYRPVESGSVVGTMIRESAPSSRTPPPLPPVAKRSQWEFPITWFGSGAVLEVGGLRLESPCVYASAGPANGHLSATDPSEILLQAPVRPPSGRPALDLGYWPWYARIEPESRHEYLTWLAAGRTRLPPNEGYLFLYFYGLERRLLVDEIDRVWSRGEVVRLRELDQARVGSREGRSFRQYSTGLLWFEIARSPEAVDQEEFDLAIGLTERWTPQLLAAPLAWLAAGERPLPAALARELAAVDPMSQRSVVQKRVPAEFAELFDARYRETFGEDGMVLRLSKRSALHTYRPASGGLDEQRCRVQNPLGIKSQFKKLPELWNSCVADLRKLSRVAGSRADGSPTVEAWEALPSELRAELDHPLAERVSVIVTGCVDASAERSAPAIVPAGRLAEVVGLERRPTLTAVQSRKLASTLQDTGYGLVPDARISAVRYGWDDLVALVPGLDGDDIEPNRYNAAVCVLRLGLSVAQADGEADELELRMLTDHIDAVFDLSPEEQQRLTALRDLLLRTGSDIAPIARKLEELLPPEARRKLGRILVVIAAAKDGIERSERNALRKAYRALGLSPQALEEAIAEVAPGAAEAEVRVRAGSQGSAAGEPIPRVEAPSFRLDHAAISSIMAETREVSVLLAAAMGAAETEVEAAQLERARGEPLEHAPETGAGTVLATPGPGGRFEPLFAALIERELWSRDEADRLARSHGLMLAAGVEVINDWAFEALGAPLIEDEGDELVLDRSLLHGSE